METTLALPTEQRPYDYDFSALELADLAPSTKEKYRRAWERATSEGVDLTDPDAVLGYALSVTLSDRRYLSAMLKIQTEAAARELKGSLDPHSATPEKVAKMQAILWKLESLQKAIPIHEEKGKTAHIWLTQDQVDQLTAIALSRSMRDYIVLATLLGAGLRRQEMSSLTFEALMSIPVGKVNKDVLQVKGKGDKPRVILISPLLASRLKEWKQTIGDGQVARSINKAGKIGESMSEDGIFDIVRKYGALIGLTSLDPHDCRRSYGRLVYEETHDIMLVRDLLGHKDVRTTMRYIGLDLNLNVDASNFVIREHKDFFMPVSGD